MQTKLIEATDGCLYGKFLLGRFDTEWARRPEIYRTVPGEEQARWPLLRQEGWGPEHLLVLDISRPGVGGIFTPRPHGLPEADLEKRGLLGLV